MASKQEWKSRAKAWEHRRRACEQDRRELGEQFREAIEQRDQARETAARLEEENARLIAACRQLDRSVDWALDASRAAHHKSSELTARSVSHLMRAEEAVAGIADVLYPLDGVEDAEVCS